MKSSHCTVFALSATVLPVSSFMSPLLRGKWESVPAIRRGTATENAVRSRRLIRFNSESSISPDEERQAARQIPKDDEEAERMEREYYERQGEFSRLSKLRQELESVPQHRQCHRYRWHQTKTMFDVEIPMLTPCNDDDLWLVVDSEQLQVAIKTDESFGAITGLFTGKVDPASCSFRQHMREGEPYIHLQIKKAAAAGTYEFWREFLQCEVESPTIRFAGETERYRWKQNAETIEIQIPVPDDVSKRRTKLKLDPSGASMHLSFMDQPDFEPLEGSFKGLICPLDSVWMLDECDTGKILALTIKKRREAKDCTAWWSGVLEGDDKW